MRDGMTIVSTYLTEIEAEQARTYLQSMGLAAAINKDNCGGMRPHLDLHQGVKLLVPDADAEAARKLLADNGEDAGPAWECSACGETSEGNFDACWNCGRPRD